MFRGPFALPVGERDAESLMGLFCAILKIFFKLTRYFLSDTMLSKVQIDSNKCFEESMLEARTGRPLDLTSFRHLPPFATRQNINYLLHLLSMDSAHDTSNQENYSQSMLFGYQIARLLSSRAS